MSLSQRQKWILAVSALSISVLLGLIALTRYVPFYVENTLLPHWASQAGFDLQAVRIRCIGWRGADVGPIQLKLGGRPFLEIDAIQVNYSPLSLLTKRISSIVVGGVQLEVTLNPSGTAIEGWPRSTAPAKPGPPVTLSDVEKWLSIGLGHLTVRHAAVTLHWRGSSLLIPMALDVHTRSPQAGRLDLSAMGAIRGNRLDFNLELDARANTLDLSMAGKGLRPETFADLLALIGPATAAGAIDVEARAQAALHPFAVRTVSASALVSQARIGVPGMMLESSERGAGNPVPIALQVASAGENDWRWSAAPLALAGPVRVNIPDLAGRITRNSDGWHAEARLHTELPVQALNNESARPWRLDSPLKLNWEAAAHMAAAGGAAQFELHTTSREPADSGAVHLHQGPSASLTFTTGVEIAGRLEQGALSGRFRIAAEQVRVAAAQARISCPQVILSGAILSNPALGIKARADFPDLKIDFDQGYAQLPQNRIEADLRQGADADWSLTGTVTSQKARVVQKTHALEMRGLSLRLPLRWPAAAAAPDGSLAVGQIRWKRNDIGGLKGSIGIKGENLWARLRHQSKLFPGLIVQMESEAGVWGAKAVVDIPSYETASTIDLGRFVPGAAGYSAAGRLQARVRLEIEGATTRSDARITLDQGVVRQAYSQLVVEGIACDVHLVDLMPLRSAPRQQLRVEALTMGNLSARSLQVDFQIEPENTLFIERADLQWCRGEVQTQALRIKPGLEDLDATLYCDRLNLAMVLGQLGAARGSGDGEVNGRIPIGWHNGRLSFDNGFLYSTPGQTGTIQLEGTETLLAGLPPGSPQRIQLDIATEALRDYSYNWAKLKIDSQQDILLMRLQLDGKPNRLLPFAYDTQAGNFIRLKGAGEAEFKGISIDLNFRTPLQEILHYGELAAPAKK